MKRTPLKKVSKKQAVRLAKYRSMCLERAGEKCFVSGCGWKAQEWHHPKGRVSENLYYFFGVCQSHHRYIHDNPKWAYENGYMEKRI